MGTILFASDLDNTLLFSHRHRQPEDRCVERLNGAEQGFFTRETPDLLPQVVQRVHLLPITTRSIEQYQRIQWPGRHGRPVGPDRQRRRPAAGRSGWTGRGTPRPRRWSGTTGRRWPRSWII